MATGYYVNGNGEKKFLESRQKNIEVDGVKWVRIAKPRPKSRADRRDDVVTRINGLVEKLENLKGVLESSDITEELVKSSAADAELLGSSASDSESDVDELKGELESWRDNMQGTNLEGTDKYQTLDESVQTLENCVGNIGNADLDTFRYSDLASPEENAQELAEAIDRLVDSLNEIVGELEGVEFPSMYG